MNTSSIKKLYLCHRKSFKTYSTYEINWKNQFSSIGRGDVFHADVLLGTWQCYYPMIIGGMEFKQIKFMSGGKADITMAKQRDTEWFTETYNYAYYGNTLRFSRSGSNISLTIDGYLFPELYLRDSFGRYTMAKRRADGC